MARSPREQSLQVGDLDPSEHSSRRKSLRSHRMVSALRERDWLGVIIELAIVTIGVVIAFQIDQWGQDRRQAREERQFLERMWEETSSIATESKSDAEMHSKEAASLLAIYRAADDPVALKRFEDEKGGAGCRTGVLPSLGVSDTSAQELLTSGRLSIVSDPSLRERLRRMAAMQVEAAEQLAYARQNAPKISEQLDHYTTSALDGRNRNACQVKWSSVLADPLGVQALLRARRIHEMMADESTMVWRQSSQVHAKLACELRKKDCRQ